MHILNVVYEEIENSLPLFLKLLNIVKEQEMCENELIIMLKPADYNELPYLQVKVEYFRNEINKLKLERTKCTNDVLALTKRIDELRETVNVYESSLSEKREEIAILNQEQKMLDAIVFNNNSNKNDAGIEIFYASRSWNNLNP